MTKDKLLQIEKLLTSKLKNLGHNNAVVEIVKVKRGKVPMYQISIRYIGHHKDMRIKLSTNRLNSMFLKTFNVLTTFVIQSEAVT